jgi:hypothetical protein
MEDLSLCLFPDDLGRSLPLMVLYTPWLLPSTTILPSQFLRIKSAEEIKRREALLEVGKELRRTRTEEDFGSPTVRSRGGLPVLAGLSPELVKGLCKALDLGTVAPMFWLQRRLTKRISWAFHRLIKIAATLEILIRNPFSDIVVDDNDLRRSLPGEKLAVEEKRLILGERGLWAIACPSKLESVNEANSHASVEPGWYCEHP